MARTQGVAAAVALALSGCATAASIIYPVNREALEARPGDYTLDPQHASVLFAVEHLGFSTFYGRFADISGRLALNGAEPPNSDVAIRIGAASIDTLSVDLNDQLKGDGMFDAAAHPDILFSSTRVSITGENEADVEGVLTIKGVSAPLTIHAVFHGGGTAPVTGARTVGFDASAALSRKQFGLDRWSGFVGDEVRLIISAEFVQEK
ncbi:MAG: YceI family protein [Amphiplicatus sp.]